MSERSGVSRNQDAALIFAHFDDTFIRGAAQRLLVDGYRIVASRYEQVGGVNRQILVDPELHAASGTSSS